MRGLRQAEGLHGSYAPRHALRLTAQSRPTAPGRHGRRPGLQVVAGSFTDVAGLLVFSAVPFLAVQALADSPLGRELQERLEAQKAALQAQAGRRDRERQRARQERCAGQIHQLISPREYLKTLCLPCFWRSPWFGPERPQWLGPLSPQPPAWLDGELPGDYGFDTAQLGRDPAKLDRYVELELLHARWAMLGALGALLPEALQETGAAAFLEPVWWRVGAAKLQGEDLN